LLAPFWIGTVLLVVVVVARFVAWDDRYSLTLLNSVTVWIFLPAYIVAVAAWIFGRWVLAALATVAVGFHVVMLATTVGSTEPITDAARAAPRLRVLTANVKYDNPDRDALARELLAADADVVLLQEITPGWVRAFSAAGFDAEYPYSVNYPNGAGGQAVYSRLPLLDVRRAMREFWPTYSARVEVGATSVSLVDVHAIGPPQGMDRHNDTVDSILDVTRSMPEPRVVAGDFNATPYNETMHRFADLGLDSAFERRGRGLDVTWPNGERLFPPPIQVDHVLVDDGIVVLDVETLRGTGSDHQPIVVDLAITE
jgi:endonuclease/exonuclease/phosphatase (EEP) superfamily protein YafD